MSSSAQELVRQTELAPKQQTALAALRGGSGFPDAAQAAGVYGGTGRVSRSGRSARCASAVNHSGCRGIVWGTMLQMIHISSHLAA